jgi:multidrug resistance efflux pump
MESLAKEIPKIFGQNGLWEYRAVSDDLAAAVRAYDDARAAVTDVQTEAERLVAEARAEVAQARTQLADAIVAAVRGGMRQRDVVAVTGYSRERIRQICRAAGVEPDED